MLEVLTQLATWLDVGFGAACFVILVRGRIPQRIERLEKHAGLPPLAASSPASSAQ